MPKFVAQIDLMNIPVKNFSPDSIPTGFITERMLSEQLRQKLLRCTCQEPDETGETTQH
jgi:hypothetical protein